MAMEIKRKESTDLDDLESGIKSIRIVKSPNELDAEERNEISLIKSKKQLKSSEKVIPKKVVLAWKFLSLRKVKKRILTKNAAEQNSQKVELILDDIAGLVEPGEILAIMGPSGAGKTSLLNALSYSTKRPLKVDGRIMINGCDADATRMAMISRYIQQEDLFFGTLTVKEHLTFHAMLRLDKTISREDKLKRVEKVLKEFNLEKRSNVKIGIPGRIKGISGGEKRRLSFASEILTDPPLLFCDEPTSGLDSFMAKSIVYYLQRMAQSGKTIVCTIHQPSSEIFNTFDKICLLTQSRVAYFGPREKALEFFSQKLKKDCPAFTNPADFYMDVLGIDVNEPDKSKAEIISYCDIYAQSEYNVDLNNRIENVQAEYFSAPKSYTPYKSNWFEQIYFLLDRSFKNYIRNHKVVLNDLFMVLITAFLGGLIYFRTGIKEDGICKIEEEGIINISFALFYTITTCVLFSILAAVMAFPIEIPIYNREHSASVYRSDTYYISKLINEVPIYIILPTIHAVIIYFMVGFGCDTISFFVFLLTDILVSNAAYSLGHILSVVSSDVNFAVSLTAPTIAIQMLFSGFFLNRTLRTPEFITYIKYISVFNYAYDLLMTNQWMHAPEIKCKPNFLGVCFITGETILEESKIDSKQQALNAAMLVILAVSFRIIAFFILWAKGHRTSIRTKKLITKFRNAVDI